MNTQLNIRTRARLFSSSFVTLLIGIVAMLAFGGPSVQAQTTAPAGTVDSSITIPIKGSVSDPRGTVTVTGNVIVTCRRVIDTTSQTTPALVLLDFDFSQVTGSSGATKATLKTYITGENHANEIRPFQASDTIIVTAPYFDSATKDELSARTMLVTASLTFDVSTGKLTGGSLSVGNNVVTSTAVGSVTASDTPIQ
ncbi:MAG TPA: hypothetical protein VE980_19080 [Pyrinomonadaceae bacterium]|nr:hypothetical protein [Pyrinomonadaceae bacterium]